mmetsp:Transcript_133718/g.303310  ORF Transcript_133718/g.303310 Transcript_133718/m.303310 type:complete len:208 (-) Transcript_133718:135-758(-)
MASYCISATVCGAKDAKVPLPQDTHPHLPEQYLRTYCHTSGVASAPGAPLSSVSVKSPAPWKSSPLFPWCQSSMPSSHACLSPSGLLRLPVAHLCQASILMSAQVVSSEKLRAQGVSACFSSLATMSWRSTHFQWSPASSICLRCLLPQPNANGNPAASPMARPTRLWACLRWMGSRPARFACRSSNTASRRLPSDSQDLFKAFNSC